MRYNNILLIDDDIDDQELFLQAIEEISDTIKCAAMYNAKEALDKLIKQSIVPDIIFLDLNMPLMSGQQFLVEIKKNMHIKNIPVIIFSTCSQMATIQLMKELGGHDFITKPSSYEELVAILTQSLK